jgi:hypothetical protein
MSNQLKINTMNFVSVNFISIRKSVSDFLKRDKLDGLKKCWYFQHFKLNQTQALDTRDEYLSQVEFYKSQGILPYKTIIPSKETIRKVGATSVKLHVFRKEGEILQKAFNENGEFVVDNVGIAFDYFPSDYEICIAEVQFVKPK